MSESYKLVHIKSNPTGSVVRIGNAAFGNGHFAVIAGPCAVESYDQLFITTKAVVESGAQVLRGGAYKPRTSPYSFQGLEEAGLRILQRVSRELNVPFVTEVLECADVPLVAEYAHAIQIGSRNMQNFKLLKAAGQCSKPVLLKRGMSARIDELLLAAEYIATAGNPNIILCERGIRTFETATRNTLDLNAIPALKARTHLPIIVDPSHGTGVRDYVIPMAKAATACGADGIIVEVHCNPPEAMSDGEQSLYPKQFGVMMKSIVTILGVR